MVAIATRPEGAAHRARPQPEPFRLLTVAALASLGAGAIHATAAGVHSEHRQAVVAFVAVALFQIGWGVLALLRQNLSVALLGAAGNLAALAGWVMAKTSGISFVEGLEDKESVQVADALAAGGAALAVGAAIVAVVARDRLRLPPRTGRALTGMAVVAAVLVTVPGMVEAGTHRHDAGSGHDGGSGHDDHTAMAHDDDGAAATAAHAHATEGSPFDPTKPIDLGGMPGVTPEQQAEAENLLALNLARLPQWADTNVAYAAGYRSIGDKLTGEEHWIKWSTINDDVILDPDQPESLVYKVNPDGTRTLEAAMYMLPEGNSLDTAPPVGGDLIQWHIHNNLCFTEVGPEGAKVAGITTADGPCPDGLVKFAPMPMIHVWIVPNACGPFASLEGVAAGQIAPGEERLCDHAHGDGGL